MLWEAMTIAAAHDLPDEPVGTRSALARGTAVLTRAGVQVPVLQDWWAALAYLGEFLSARRVIRGSDAFERVGEEAAALAEHDPLAALLPTAALVGQWEGSGSDWLFVTRRGAMNWGWHGVVLPLAQVLAKVPAFWSARHLVAEAIDALWTVRVMPATEYYWYTAEALAGFRELRDQLDSGYIRLHATIARDIQHASRPATAPIRSAIAALWWTLGDPWHAHGVADGTFQPTLRQVLLLTDRILRSAFLDPMLAATGARLWQKPGLRPERHQSAYRRMVRYAPSEHFADFENIINRTGVSPSNAYARALTSYFAGTSSAAERDTIRVLVPQVQVMGGRAAIRFTALHLLLEAVGGRVPRQRWAELAQRAAIASSELSYRVPYSYDRSCDLPLYYLEGGSDDVFSAVEHHRGAAMDFVLRNLRPFPPTAAGSATLVAEEDQLLEQVRELRHGSVPTGLPGQRVHGRAYDREPALTNRIGRLDGILGQLTTIAPDYAVAERFRARRAADLARAFEAGPPALTLRVAVPTRSSR